MWPVEVEVAENNHEPFVHPSAHPSGRHLTFQQQEYVISLGRAGITPGRILTLLRQQDDNVNIIAQDVYNIRRTCRASFLSGRSSLHALLDSLTGERIQHPVKLNDKNQLSRLFIVSESAKKYAASSAGDVSGYWMQHIKQTAMAFHYCISLV